MADFGGWSGSRRLLQRLRDIMAAPGKAQSRLDQVVRLIAANMVAEVCSIYVMRAGEVLELFATEGLNPGAVHQTRLRVGEGLVGFVAAQARAVALHDAQAHPNFVYRPETGEEIFNAFMGVPILRGGRVLGVLVVQNKAHRRYEEEEIEALQTIAMVVAEMIAGGELVGREELLPADGIGLLPLRLDGIAFNQGIAMGQAVLHEPRIVVEKLVGEDPERELDRLKEALDGMHSALDDLFAASDLAHGGEHREVLETFRMIAEDRGWLGRIREAISGGLTAEAAVQRSQDDIRTRMHTVTDPYLRERLHDFEDLTNRLLLHLTGEAPTADKPLPDDVVLLARNMGPAELLDYDRARLRALVLEEGSPTSHVSIVARALDIPLVGQIRNLLERIEPGDPMIVDGDHAQIFLRPGEDVLAAFQDSLAARQERRAAYHRERDLPAQTRDGTRVALMLNAGLLIDLAHLDETGADGIGLYRTEIPFMARPTYPDVRAQTELYQRIYDETGDRPVVFRTLDVGGDKLLPYFGANSEENPALGWRALRILLDRPAILRQQLRALMRAARGRTLYVMFPMVSEVAEYDAARHLLDMEHRRLADRGEEGPTAVRVGAMLEVPALVWQLQALLPRLDFLSIGSNDLFQFLFASDRGNPKLAERYDTLSPSALAMLRHVVCACDAAGVPVTLCGEMAGRPLEAMTLIGLGFRSISMAAASVGPVKQMVRSLDLHPLQDLLANIEDRADHSLRGRLRDFAHDHGVAI